MDEEKVFKALADENRRKLLDLLFQRDGQTVSELEAHLPMTRFGAMKHLQILEDAGLLTTQKIGREKHHYLNPIPVQLVYERWVSKYAQPWTQTLSGLKNLLEDQDMTQKPSHVFQIYIRTTPERLWQALTDGDITQQYYFGSRVDSTWNPGTPYRYPNPAGGLFVEGEIIEIDPPRRLVTTFQAKWQTDYPAIPTSKVTWEIEPVGAACKLTLTHDDLDLAEPLSQDIVAGWAQIISSMKSLLETGEPLIYNQP
ncbi:MAG: metalloregulator ArsR/SmtB family transcription factor [Chitinophagaceae bacterium]|nr:metalloregulator ArsR/SmtB family transcription factor [Anaerolineae bacterium]